jgi:hypothetical protein
MNVTTRLAVGVAATALTLGTAAGTASAATASTAATATTARAFTCTGSAMGSRRAYAKQTVTGTLWGTTPANVKVINYLGTVITSSTAPKLDNAWWGGTFKSTNHWNQWKVGTTATGDIAHVMLPDTTPGATFTAELVTEFAGGANGNWQNVMSCTAA